MWSRSAFLTTLRSGIVSRLSRKGCSCGRSRPTYHRKMCRSRLSRSYVLSPGPRQTRLSLGTKRWFAGWSLTPRAPAFRHAVSSAAASSPPIDGSTLMNGTSCGCCRAPSQVQALRRRIRAITSAPSSSSVIPRDTMASRISATGVMLTMTAASSPPSASSVTYSSKFPPGAAAGTLLGLGSCISGRIRVDMRVNEGVFHDHFALSTRRNGANLHL